MSYWLPQNIQKRILLYFAQQLSVFTQLDLENLDVSLGSESKFTFSNVELDTEKFSTPDFVFRSGSFAKLDLYLNVNGGVTVDAVGCHFVVAPYAGTDTTGSFSLQKSTYDLTTSIIESVESSDDAESIHQTSTMDSMRNKVLEIALAKLQVSLKDIHVKLILPHDTVSLKIESIICKSLGSKRQVEIKGLVICAHVETDSGVDLDTDHEDDLMSSSLFFSKEQASSLYMSALQVPSAATDYIELISVNEILIEFEGMNSLEQLYPDNLQIEIDKIKAQSIPILEVSYPLVQMLSKLSKTKPETRINGYDRFQNDQKIEHQSIFECLQVNNIILDVDGLIASFSDIAYTEESLVVSSMSISHDNQEILQFSQEPVILMKESNVHIEPFSLEVEKPHIFQVLKFSQKLHSILGLFDQKQNASPKTEVFTAFFGQFSLKLVDYDTTIEFDQFTCRSKAKLLLLPRVTIKKGSTTVIEALDISFENFESEKVIQTFDSSLHEIAIMTANVFSIRNIIAQCSEETLRKMIQDISSFIKDLPMMSKQRTAKGTSSGRLFKSVRLGIGSSILLKPSFSVSHYCAIGSISMRLNHPILGGIRGKLTDSTIWYTNEGVGHFHIQNILVTREHQKLIYLTNQLLLGKPVVSAQLSFNSKVLLHNLTFEYYAKYLDYLEFFKTRNNGNLEETSVNIGDFEVKFSSCSLGLSPYQLNSKLVVALHKSVLKSHDRVFFLNIRSATLLLIDCISNITAAKIPSKHLSKFFSLQGYASVGKVEEASIELKDGFCKALINSVELALCADSMHCLMQTLNDMKLPPIKNDPSRYKFELESNLDVFKDVDNDEFAKTELFIQEPFEQVDSIHTQQDSEGSVDMVASNINIEEDHFAVRKQVERNHSVFSVGLITKKVFIKLYDGYDWKFTRKEIMRAVEKVENAVDSWRDGENYLNPQSSGTNVTESLFESIYLAASVADDKRLSAYINEELDNANDEGLNLKPSKEYKVLVDITTVDVKIDMINDQVISSEVSLSFEDLDIIDNIPTSTWNKFATSMKESERPLNAALAKLKLQVVKPVQDLSATEMIIDAHVLPLSLHVDQDTLEFITRFGEFKDDRFHIETEDIYIQKFSVNSINLKLDYKPKKVNYVGLRSGHTSEFMNFFILDGSMILLRSVVLYGFGLPRLHPLLSSLWTPDVTSTQLAGVLSGLAPVKSVVAIGSGLKDLVVVPVEEYQKDQRLIRSLKKGATVFLKSTTGEVLKLGIKLAAGTQTVLEHTEHALGGMGAEARQIDTSKPKSEPKLVMEHEGLTNDPSLPTHLDIEERVDPPKLLSLYADQPLTAHAGLGEAYGSLGKNMNIAYGAIKVAGTEISSSDTAQSAAVSFFKATPVAVLRPLIGATEAMSRALQGVVNEMDPEQVDMTKEKYKSAK